MTRQIRSGTNKNSFKTKQILCATLEIPGAIDEICVTPHKIWNAAKQTSFAAHRISVNSPVIYGTPKQISAATQQISCGPSEISPVTNRISFTTHQTSFTTSEICCATTEICLKANQISFVTNQIWDDTSHPSRPQCVSERGRKPDLVCGKPDLFYGKTNFANGVRGFGWRDCDFVFGARNHEYSAPDFWRGNRNLPRLSGDLTGLKEDFRDDGGSHIHRNPNRLYAGPDFIPRGLNLFRAVPGFFAAAGILFVAKEIDGGAPSICFDPNQNTINKEKTMSKHVRILHTFAAGNDSQLIASAVGVVKGVTTLGLQNLPVDPKAVQTAVEELIAAIGAQATGGPPATALKNDKRDELIALLRKLAHYIQDESRGNPTLAVTAGFNIATAVRTKAVLAKPTITAIDSSDPGELVVNAKSVGPARTYEMQYALIDADGKPGPWLPGGTFHNSRAMTVKGLTPLKVYSVQVRAFGGSKGYTPWSDPVSHHCV